LHGVRQVLVKVGERIWIGRQGMILSPQAILPHFQLGTVGRNDGSTHAGGELPESLEIDHVQRTDMIWAPLEGLLPVSGLPEAESLHLFTRVAHGCVAVNMAVEVGIDQFLHVCPDDLVRVDEDDLVEVHREEHIEEEDLVSDLSATVQPTPDGDH
jgi:hypothetical protein